MKKIIIFIVSVLTLIGIYLLYFFSPIFSPVDILVQMETRGTIIPFSQNPNGIFEKKESKNEYSNGIIISPHTILTTAHSVGEKSDTYNINSKIKATLLHKNEKEDIAILETNNTLNYQKIPLNTKVEKGQFVYSLSKDTNQHIIQKSGTVLEKKGSIIFVDILFEKGDSGGALFDEHKNLIGIILSYNFKEKYGIVYDVKDIIHRKWSLKK